MSKERELLQRCLDEFEYKGVACNELCIDINKLLAQPEQEPVAWMQDSIELYVLEEKSAIRGYVIPLYTAPPKREPLSDDEMIAIWKEGIRCEIPFVEIGRAIEKAHGIGGEE